MSKKNIPQVNNLRVTDIDIFATSRNNHDREIMQPIRVTGGPATKRRKWKQVSRFR